MQSDAVVITGASSGIGAAIARIYAQRSLDLVLVARSQDKLDALAAELDNGESTITVVALDLSLPDAPAQLQDYLRTHGICCRILINNAGFGARGIFDALSWERQQTMIRLNIAALTELCHRLLPGMRSRKRGSILNVASTAAFQPGPHLAVYYATKAYVLSFSEALREELRGTGIGVSCLCPGPTRTNFAHEADMSGTPIFRYAAMPVDRVARAAVRGLDRDRAIIVPGWRNRLGAVAPRLTPRWMVRRLVGKLQA